MCCAVLCFECCTSCVACIHVFCSFALPKAINSSFPLQPSARWATPLSVCCAVPVILVSVHCPYACSLCFASLMMSASSSPPQLTSRWAAPLSVCCAMPVILCSVHCLPKCNLLFASLMMSGFSSPLSSTPGGLCSFSVLCNACQFVFCALPP